MHQRVGVDTFDGAGEGKRGIDIAATSFGGGETKDRPQSFASGKKTVPHRLVERDRFGARFGQIPIKRAIDHFLPGPKILFEIHRTEANAEWSILVTV